MRHCTVTDKILGRANGLAISMLQDYAGYSHYETFPVEDFDKSRDQGDKFSITENLGYSIYPNPATDYVMVDLENEIEWVDIDITDLLGRVQLRTNAQSGQPIDLRELESGTYLLTVTNKGEVVLSESISVE